MGNGPTRIATVVTRCRPWWLWKLIRLVRVLHDITGRLLSVLER